MRMFSSLFFAGLIAFSHANAAKVVPVNGENISFAARTLDRQLDWETYTHDYLRYSDPQKFNSLSHDPKQLEAAIVDATRLLKAQTKTEKRYLQTLELEAEILRIEPQAKGAPMRVSLSSALTRGTYVVEPRANRGGAYILPAYILLLANPKVGTQFEMSGTEAVETQGRLQAGETIVGYLRAEIELVKFHQHEYVTAVLRKVSWYRDPNRKELLGTVQEKRKADEMLKSRYLSEGVTLVADPNHSVTVGDLQPLEILEQELQAQPCTELPREQGHRVFECSRELQANTSENKRVVARYVGGRRVQISLHAAESNGQMSEAEAKSYVYYRFDLKPSQTGPTWESACCDFAFNVKNFVQDFSKPYLVMTTKVYKALLAGDKKYAVVP